MQYLLANSQEDVDIKGFEKASGVGVTVNPEQIEQEVRKTFQIDLLYPSF